MKFFPLEKGFQYGMSCVPELNKIKGRSIISPFDAGLLAQMIVMGKHGDHVEIGTLFGGSAIIAARTKKHFGLCGTIHCIDPLENSIPDAGAGIYASKEVIVENASMFGVEDRIVVHEQSSYPFPLKQSFATGYIDGDHWNNFPIRDWESLSRYVSYMVMFDDYCHGKPEVLEACLQAADDSEWVPVFVGGMSFIVRRRE